MFTSEEHSHVSVVAACMHLSGVRALEVHIHSFLHAVILYVNHLPSDLSPTTLSCPCCMCCTEERA